MSEANENSNQYGTAWYMERIATLTAERDAARAEVERLREEWGEGEQRDYVQHWMTKFSLSHAECIENRKTIEYLTAELARVRERCAEYEGRMRAAEAVNGTEKLREALEYIAHFPDAAMEGAKTLHWDMRAKARDALATAPNTADRGNQGEVQAFGEAQGAQG